MRGNSAAYEIFKALTEYLTPESLAGLLVQELHTLEAAKATLLPHPLCPVCSTADYAATRQRLSELTAPTAESASLSDELWQRCAKLVDARTGLFQGLQDETHI